MRRYVNLKVVVVMLMFVMLSAGLMAQPPAKRLPDLTVVKIAVDRGCNLVVVVRNNGPGMLPNKVYTDHHPKSAGVYVHINGKKWGGQSIWKFDAARNLQKPGGVASCTLNYKVSSPINVRAVVDLWNKVRERNERNNTLVRRKLTCGGSPGGQAKRPDLIVRDIRLVQNCKIQVTVKNIGTAGVPAAYYDLPDAVAVQMYKGSKPWGGIILKGFDPAGKLKAPGGTAVHTWFPNAANLNLGPGVHSIKVVVDFHKKLTELNETNNTLTRRLNCRPTRVPTGPLTTVTPVTTLKPVTPTLTIKAPQRFFLDFTDAYLVYTPASQGIQIVTNQNVLSYGGDWEKCQLKPYLYHIRQKVWKGFYWKVNTSRKEVYKVTGGSFCQLGGSEQKLPVTVDVVGGGSTAPDRFFLRFAKAYLVYVPGSKTLQVATLNTVLSYGLDWQKCNKNNFTYHLKQNVWKGFHWNINTLKKKAVRIRGGAFCGSGGSTENLNMTVRVVN